MNLFIDIAQFFHKDFFLWQDFLKNLRRKHSVAFVVDEMKTYNTALASTRLRCYDIINYLEGAGVRAELYKNSREYDVVIFSKTSSNKSVLLAENLRERNIPIIYDIYSDYFEDKERVEDIKNILSISAMSAAIITCSERQQVHFNQLHPKVYCVPEGITEKVMMHRKKHYNKRRCVLVYCGYAEKAKDTLFVKSVIQKFQKEYKCRLLYICQRNPGIKEFKYQYVKYDQKKIGKYLCKGDIMIAPRDVSVDKNLEHSFTKIGLPMAVGLPVVASPIPAYIGSPALLCENEEEWGNALEKLITSYKYRMEKANEGIDYIRKNYMIDIIGMKYIEIIKACVKGEKI